MKGRCAVLIFVFTTIYSTISIPVTYNAPPLRDWFATLMHAFNQAAIQVEYLHDQRYTLEEGERSLLIDGILGLYATAQWTLETVRNSSCAEDQKFVLSEDQRLYMCEIFSIVDHKFGEIKKLFTEDQRTYFLYVREILAENLAQI